MKTRNAPLLGRLLLALVPLCIPVAALADFAFTVGAGQTAVTFTTSGGCSGKHCFASVPINSSATEIFTAAAPGTVTGSGTAGSAATGVVTVQGITSMEPLIVAGAAGGPITVSQATSSNLNALVDPLTVATWGIQATGSAVPANAKYTGINVGGTTRGATGLGLGSHYSQTVAIVDASGNQITSFSGSGGTSATFGDPMPATGTAAGLYDGTNMVRARGDETNGLWVNVKSATGVAQSDATSGQTLSPVGVAVVTSAPTYVNGNTNIPSATIRGGLWVNHDSWVATALGSGSNFGTTPGAVHTGHTNASCFLGTVACVANSGNVGTGTQRVVIATDQPAFTTAMPTNVNAAATGGATPHNVIAANTNNSTNLKASAGTVYGIQLSGLGAAPAYLKLYDKATAPTCGTDTPVAVYMIPANSTAANGGGNNANFAVGKAFTLGIGYCVVTGIPATDNTAVAAATYAINIDWK
jgi:hypothetical protein